MSDEEILAESERLDRCYAEAAAFDAANQPIGPLDEEGYFHAESEGAMEAYQDLRRSALDHKGRP